MARRILIIGGTGVFGMRLARHLATFDGIELFISSRSAAKAKQFAASLKAQTPDLNARGIELEHGENLGAQLCAIRPFAAIDCSGPFQNSNYDTARAIVASGAHLIDIADARRYLAKFASELDDLACSKGVSALTGASSTPTLSSCVIDEITYDWTRIDTVDICITPGGKSEVGRSVIEAILSYAGKPIPTWINGKLDVTTGWTGARRVEIPKLGCRRVAPVETFDAEYLGARCKVQSRVSFSAGLESRIEQIGIEIIANLRKIGLFPDPQALIPALLNARKITRIPTSDKGGMLVEVSGLDGSGRFTQVRWSLIAINDHGPFIPILPAAAALGKLFSDGAASGASFAHDHISLRDILDQMTAYDITTQTDISRADQSVFERYLGRRVFQKTPPALQRFHKQTAPPVWTGQADIKSGRGLLVKGLSRIFGLPKTGVGVPVIVSVERTISASGEPVERWARRFAGKMMSSVLRRGSGGQFTEGFSPFAFTLKLNADETEIRFPVSRWTIGKIPLPMFLAPRSDSREFQDDVGRFRFDVRLTLPLVGLIAHYQGWLETGNS